MGPRVRLCCFSSRLGLVSSLQIYGEALQCPTILASTNAIFRIIVGVKYCFRYNQRNRRAQQDENGEPIDLNTMPRAHRRRREKKLMTMEEVNERFPLLKYKAWMASRAEEGLPTAGGVAAPSSRPGSVKNAEGTLEAENPMRKSHESHQSHTSQGPTTSTAPVSSEPLTEKPSPLGSDVTDTTQEVPSPPTSPKSPRTKKTTTLSPASPINNASTLENHILKSASTPANPDHDDDHSDMEDDDQIQNAVPTAMMEHPGDSCAICIDTLENDDDVRGLTCGHAFHASCLDPWLTSRRACCPLCKADYYVPKPRPEGEACGTDGSNPGAAGTANSGRRLPGMSSARIDGPNAMQSAYVGGRGRPRLILPGRFITIGHSEGRPNRYGFPTVQRHQRSNVTRTNANGMTPGDTVNSVEAQPQQSTGWRSRLPNLRMPGRFGRGRTTNTGDVVGVAPVPTPQQQERTPGQLEAAS